MFSGGQLKAPGTVCSEHSRPWKCRRKAEFPPHFYPCSMDQCSAQNCFPPVPRTILPGHDSGTEWDAVWLKPDREQVPDGKWSMGLLGKGTGNSSYGQTRGAVRWIFGNNQVRGKTKERTRNGMTLVLGQWHSMDLWSQDHVGHSRCSWGSMPMLGTGAVKSTITAAFSSQYQEWIWGLLMPMGICETSCKEFLLSHCRSSSF